MQAHITVQDCDQIDVSASATATTFYWIPEPVMNARVVNDTNSTNCVIEWGRYNNSSQVLYYYVSSVFSCNASADHSRLYNYDYTNQREKYTVNLAAFALKAY